MGKQILTLDNLYQFYLQKNETITFSSKESGMPIVVTTNGYFESSESDMPGMLKLALKVCHIDTNRNGSHISRENMEKAMPTLKYRPILAHIHELEDGTKDFYAHNMEIIEHEDGETEVKYIEKQVGCYTADKPWFEYDKDMDKTYVRAYAVIPEQYTETADIIRRKNGTKVSCELVINELSYNAKEKYLDLTDFYFGGTTLLGVDDEGNEIGEGMLGSRADITDFCFKEPVFTYQDKMIEVLEKLNTTLSNFNTNTQKGGNDNMNKFEELLAKYGKTAEDVTFEIDGLSDEDLEAKFAEVFECADNADTSVDNAGVDNDDNIDGGDDSANADEGTDSDDTSAPAAETFTKTFAIELSHDDIRCALYNLISVYDEEDNDWYSIKSVYDNYFYIYGWKNDKLYKLGYSVDGENVSLEGDRQEMFEIIVSESEKLAIEKMRENYATLEAQCNELAKFKADTEAAQLQAQKDAIFANEEFEIVAETKAFKKLVENSKDYTLDECRQRAKDILEDFNSFASNFAAQNDAKKSKTLNFNFNAKPSKKKTAYGGLFDEDE